ncbi:MAG: hypothetical protein IPG45_10470 [Deltaproteobacteria bacterium]|jgi:DNA polymerase-1|nr:hypothetical protein [Deltaproteobacteria bacterium]
MDGLIRDRAGVAAFLESVRGAPFLALDTETSGLDPHLEKLLLIQFGTAEKQALVDAQAVDADTVRSIFRDHLVVMHNATFDLKMLAATYGDALHLEEAQIADTQNAEKLLRNGRKTDHLLQGFALKVLAERYAGMELDKSIRQGFFGIQSVTDLSPAELLYAARDVEATWKVFARQLEELERDGLLKVLAIEGAASVAFADLELKGAPIDKEAWKKQLDEAKSGSAQARKALDKEFWTVADRDLFGGTTLNYESDEEILGALKKLGLTLESTRREVLVASGHPAALAVAEYREHQKIVSTYGDAFLAFIHKKTGRLHPRFNAIGATTGRVSCSEPNLQNIPSGSAFRACFRAPPGRKLITADYSGAELRILAEASGDPVFIDTFRRGGDLHAIVAERLFKKPVNKHENPELRARAKAINFGLVYGMGAQGLANQLGVRLDEAERLLEAYFRAFPKIRDYLGESARQALKRGMAETMAGRRFWLTDLRRDGRDEGTLTRIAKNMPIQGTNADITKLAMARMYQAFRRGGVDAFLVNTVHDELVVEAAESVAEEAKAIVIREMRSAGAEFVKRVPMDVDAQLGDTWTK